MAQQSVTSTVKYGRGGIQCKQYNDSEHKTKFYRTKHCLFYLNVPLLSCIAFFHKQR